MKTMILVLLAMAVSCGAFAQEYSSTHSDETAYGREDRDRGPGRGPGRGGPGRGGDDDRGGGRGRPDPGPASYCSAQAKSCGNTNGESATIPKCAINCYYGSVANCADGSFSRGTSCAIEEYNSCTCLGGY